MNGINKYAKVQIMTSDRVRIIIMLYEGAIRFNRNAVAAIEKGNIEERCNYINRTMDIIHELVNSLDIEKGGEIALNLAKLYEYSLSQLVQANLKNDASCIDIVTKILAELKQGWDAIATDRGVAAGTGSAPDDKGKTTNKGSLAAETGVIASRGTVQTQGRVSYGY